MKINYYADKMTITAEDERDRVFLEEILGIKKGKVFTKVNKTGGTFENNYEIELSEFKEEIYEKHNRNVRDPKKVSDSQTNNDSRCLSV